MAYLIPTVHPAYVLRQAEPITDEIAADLAKAKRVSEEGPNLEENLCIVYPAVEGGLDNAFHVACAWLQHWVNQKTPVAIDVETSGTDYFNCKLYSIAIASAEHKVAVAFTLSDYHTIPPQHERALVALLREILADPEIALAFHNSPFDRAVCQRKGFRVAGQTIDTQAHAHLIQPGARHKDLGWQGHTHLDVPPWKIDHEGKKKAFTSDPIELLVYNAKDALYTAYLVAPQLETIAARGMSSSLVAWQSAFADLATDMELYGLPVDFELRRQMGMKLLYKQFILEKELRDFLDWPDFNPMAKAHKQEALFGARYAGKPYHLGLTPSRLTEKERAPSTSYKAIIDYLEHPFVRALTEYIECRQVYAIQYRENYDWEVWKLHNIGLPDTVRDDALRWLKKNYKQPGSYSRAICEDGRLHPHINPTGQTGSRFSTQPNCFDSDTEVLTEHGWMRWPDAYRRQPRVMQYDENSKRVRLVKAAFVQSVRNAGQPIIEVHATQIDLRVTADHRMLVSHTVQRHGKKEKVTETLPAQTLATTTKIAPTVPIRATGYDHEGGTTYSKHMITVLCACQANGWVRKYGSGESWAFYFSKHRKVRRLITALEACTSDADWYHVPLLRKGRRPQTAIYLKDSPIKRWVDALLGPHKRFGSWLLHWSTEALRYFCNETTQWNGRADRASEYSTVVRENADWVQIAGVISGSRVGHIRGFWGSRSKTPCYQISLGPREPHVGVRRSITQMRTLKLAETFYCATVPSSYLVVRRAGKVCIAGNCQNQGTTEFEEGGEKVKVHHRDFFRVGQGRAIVGADKDQLELIVAAILCGVDEILDEKRRPGGDPHRLAAHHVYGDEFDNAPPDKQKILRTMVKNVEYASLYMAGITTVWRTIRERKQLDAKIRAAMTIGNVSRIHKAFFGRWYQFPEWHRLNYDRAQRDGYLEIPPFGRRRYYPVQPPPLTEVANWPIQCLTKSRVYSESGAHRICGDTWATGELAEIGNGEGLHAPAQRLVANNAPTVHIHLATGEEPRECTPDHRWLILDEDEGYVLRRADCLRASDCLCTPLPDNQRIQPATRRGLLYWLGAIISDGTLSDNCLYFGLAKNDRPDDLAKQFYAFACQRGWSPPSGVKYPKSNLASVRYGARARPELESCGIDHGWVAHTKRVPHIAFERGIEGARQFIWGMLEADGGHTHCAPRRGRMGHTAYSFNMCNRALLSDMLDLCRYAGIESVLKGPYKADRAGHTAWRLNVHGFDAAQLLGAPETKHRSRCSRTQPPLPRPIIEDFLSTVHQSDFRHRTSYATVHHRLRNGGSTNPDTLRSMYEAAGAPTPPLYRAIPIASSVEPAEGQRTTYTLSVQHPSHLYVADGFMSANCAGSDFVGMEMVQIQDELKRRYGNRASVILHGHDAVYVECDEKDAQDVEALVNRLFGASYLEGEHCSGYLTAKASIGKSLQEVK